MINQKFDRHIGEAFVQFRGDQIVMVSLVGSQNYGLATEYSDVDTKCCVLPSWIDIVQAHQPYSHTYIFEDGEHIDFTDFREMMKILKKQNINFLEQLFTDTYFVNDIYEGEVEKLRQHREDIAHYNPRKCVDTMAGIARSKETRIFRPLGEDKDVAFNAYGYHPKELMQLCRIEEFLKKYTNGDSFEQCLKTSQRDWLLELKAGVYEPEEAKAIMVLKMNSVNEMYKSFIMTHDITNLPAIDFLMEEVTESIFRKYLKKYVLS